VSKRSWRLPHRIKLMPCLANSCAVARPIPLVAPVMNAVFFIFIVILEDSNILILYYFFLLKATEIIQRIQANIKNQSSGSISQVIVPAIFEYFDFCALEVTMCL